MLKGLLASAAMLTMLAGCIAPPKTGEQLDAERAALLAKNCHARLAADPVRYAEYDPVAYCDRREQPSLDVWTRGALAAAARDRAQGIRTPASGTPVTAGSGNAGATDPAPFRQDSCTGLCGLQRYSAARALDRSFNTNAGVQGWFGPSPGVPCTGLCSIQRYNAARALDRRFNTNAGVQGWFGP